MVRKHGAHSLSLAVVFAMLVSMLGIGTQSVQAAPQPLNTAYTQNFDTLATSGTLNTWSDDITVSGWYSNRTSYLGGSGTATNGGLYSFGSGADRALGSIASNTTTTIYYGVQLENNGPTKLTQLSVSYTGEQWRNGGIATAQKIDFQYQVDASNLTDGTWTNFDTLDFISPIATATAGALNGNDSANRQARSGTIDVDLNPGQKIWLRWEDINDAGNDHGLAVDNLSVSVGSTDDAAPTVTSTTPSNSATGISVGTNITINFSEPVNVAAGQITVECPAGTVLATNTTATNVSSLTINPTVDLPFNTVCAVTVPQGAVRDVDGNDPPDTLTTTFFTGFTTELAPCDRTVTKISAIQGSGATAAITGSVTVEGVITAIFPDLQSINVQEEPADEDGDPNTSEGISVFLGSSFDTLTSGLQVGNVIRVSGTAGERSTNDGASLQTQISGRVLLGNCAQSTATITPVDVIFPLTTLSSLEPYEGMLVRFPQELAIVESFNYDRFGEIQLGYADDIKALEGRDRFYTPTSIVDPSEAGALTQQYMLRKITLDDGSSKQNPDTLRHPNGQSFSLDNRFRSGDFVVGATGVLDESFGLYRIQPTAPATYKSVNVRPVEPENVGGRLRVAAFNTLNYFLTLDYPTKDPRDNACGPQKNVECRGADNEAERTRQRAKLLEAVTGLDAAVLGLNELENTPDVEPLADIVSGLNERLGAGTYAYIDTGVIGTDAIKVGMIYKPDVVSPIGDYQTLDSKDDSRFRDDRSRPSLAQTFEEKATGARFTVVVNHFKSKGSECGAGDDDPQQGNCNGTRTLAAQALVDWLATDPTNSNDPDFLIAGDLNSYDEENPIDAIKAGADGMQNTTDDYVDLVEDNQGEFAYSYVFDGQIGYLDYALATRSLAEQVTGATEWHINADEPDVLDYDTSFKPDSQDALYEENAFRTSDHDPVLVGLNLRCLCATKIEVTDRTTSVHGEVKVAYSNGTVAHGVDVTVEWTTPTGTFEQTARTNRKGNVEFSVVRSTGDYTLRLVNIRDIPNGNAVFCPALGVTEDNLTVPGM